MQQKSEARQSLVDRPGESWVRWVGHAALVLLFVGLVCVGYLMKTRFEDKFADLIGILTTLAGTGGLAVMTGVALGRRLEQERAQEKLRLILESMAVSTASMDRSLGIYGKKDSDIDALSALINTSLNNIKESCKALNDMADAGLEFTGRTTTIEQRLSPQLHDIVRRMSTEETVQNLSSQTVRDFVAIARKLDSASGGYNRLDRDRAMDLARAMKKQGWQSSDETYVLQALEQLIDTFFKSNQTAAISTLDGLFREQMTQQDGILATLIQHYGRMIVLSDKGPSETKEWELFEIYRTAAVKTATPLEGAAAAFEVIYLSATNGDKRSDTLNKKMRDALESDDKHQLEIFLFTLFTLSDVSRFQKEPTKDGKKIAARASSVVHQYKDEIRASKEGVEDMDNIGDDWP